MDIGKYAATSVTVVNSTEITLITPAQSEGIVDVVVTNSDDQSSTLAHAFQYVTPAPDNRSGNGGSGSGCSMIRP